MDAALGAFRTDCDAAIDSLRRAIRDLSVGAGCDPLRPQEVSRRLGINKNLTWKFARILLAPDSLEAIPMLPGNEGVEIYLRAFESSGAPAARTEALRASLRQIEQVIDRHFGDRSKLELVLDGLRSDGNLESSRRTAFKGMSGVFGLQARLRLTAQILTPSEESPGFADIALVVGLAGLQRLRPLGALPLFRSGSNNAGIPAPQPFIRSHGADAPEFLVRDFCSHPNATVNEKPSVGGRFALELSEGPLGRIGESDLFFGTLARQAIPLRRTAGDSISSLVTAVSIPAESISSDLFVHRSITGMETLRTSLHSTLSQPLSEDEHQRQASMLPIDTAPLILDDLSTGFGIAGFARYEEMIRCAFASLGRDPADYRLVRVAMAYPPAPSALLLRWDLPE